MNFGFEDKINNTILGIPIEELEPLAEEIRKSFAKLNQKQEKTLDVRCWQSILKQNTDLDVVRSFLQPWQKAEWLLCNICKTLNNKWMYVLYEYETECEPQVGIFSIVVTKEELNKYFYEDRRIELYSAEEDF